MSSRLAQYLAERATLPASTVDEALRHQAIAGGGLDTALLELGAIDEPALLTVLANVSGLPPIDLTEFEPNREVAGLIPPRLAERLKVVPLSLDGNTLHVACAEPVPQAELNEVGFLLGKELALWIAPEIRLRDWMSSLFGVQLSPRERSVLALVDPSRAAPPAIEPPKGPVPLSAAIEDALGQDIERLAEAVSQEPILLEPKQAEAGVEAEPAPPPPPAEPPPEWTLPEAKEALRHASLDREALKDVALRYARQAFDFVVAFAVIRGTAVGWDARGEGADAGKVGQVSFPLDTPSLFHTVVRSRSGFAGPLPQDPMTQSILGQLGRAPRAAFVFPIEVRGRMVALLYADSGARPLSQRKVSEVTLFCQELPTAFSELILARKQRRGELRASVGLGPEPGEASAVMGIGWAPAAPRSVGGIGRLAAIPAQIRTEAPPPDYGALLKRLTGPDPTQRARAMAELTRAPEASVRELVRHFPGPTAWSRLPISDLPEADELGPIPGALARLGRPAAQAVAALLDHDDPDVRYFALLTAGNLPHPELVSGVLRGLFDLEPEIASAARAAARALKRLPRLSAALKGLRQELTALDPVRRSLAARALGALHDRFAIDGLIGLTASDDALCAQAAVEALQEITRAGFGPSPRAWTAWWAENRERRRSEWLVAALSSREADQRAAALEELASAIGDTLGYEPEGPPQLRGAAIARWQRAAANDPRLRQLD